MAIDVSNQVAKADLHLAQKKYEMAIEVYLRVLEVDPDNRGARKGVRMAALKRAENNYPSGFAIKLQTSGHRMAIMSPNAETKFKAYEECLKVDPKNTDLAHNLADALEKAGHANGAIGVHEGTVEVNPKEGRARTALGRLLAAKEPDKALEHLEVALKLDSKNQEAMKLRKDLAAELSIKRTGFETARTTHDLLRDKDKAKELGQADKLQRSAGETGDIISRLQATVKAQPADRKAQRELARAFASANRIDEATAAWERLIELDPGDFDAKVQLGDLKLSQLDRALLAAEKKGDKLATENLRRRKLETTIHEYSLRVAEHPTDTGLRYQLGETYLQAERLDDAIGEFQKAVKDPRKRVDALNLLGEAFLRQGHFDLAARQLERALEESPGLNSERGKSIVYTLGLLRERQGDRAAARAEYLKVYEVDVSFRDIAKKVAEVK